MRRYENQPVRPAPYTVVTEQQQKTGIASSILTGIGLALTGTSIGLSASGALNPNQPNLAASSKQMADIQALLLPGLRRMQAQAETGGSTVIPGYNKHSYTAETAAREIAKLQTQLQTEQDPVKRQMMNLLVNSIPKNGGTIYTDNLGRLVPASKAVADFKGLSQADIEGKISKALAQGQLDLSKKYDAAFIDSALAQEKLADPNRFEARDMLYKDIQHQLENPPKSPVSEEVQRQVTEKVAAGSKLTPHEQAMLDQTIAHRGGTIAGTDFSKSLTTGMAGSARERNNAASGTAWLSSGMTPEDINYRSEQQNLGNLAAYIKGETPQSQFKELSGAQSGPTPVAQGTPLPGYNTQAGQQGAGAAVTGFQQQVSAANGQVSPWFAGLSGVLGLARTAGNLGWKPLAAQTA